jgi:hypothetical protein
MWKWLGVESWLPEHIEALSDRDGRLKPVEGALRYLLRIADQSHIVLTDVSRVWWWAYGAELEVLKNESAELAMNIRVTFPFASDIKAKAFSAKIQCSLRPRMPQNSCCARLLQTNVSGTATFLSATRFM